MSDTETLICRREMSLIGSTSFGFAQKKIHDFQNTVLNSMALSSTNATKMVKADYSSRFKIDTNTVHRVRLLCQSSWALNYPGEKKEM